MEAIERYVCGLTGGMEMSRILGNIQRLSNSDLLDQYFEAVHTEAMDKADLLKIELAHRLAGGQPEG